VDLFREPQEINDPYKTQKCCGGLRPPPHFWVLLFLVSPLENMWGSDRNFDNWYNLEGDEQSFRILV
jgi:hypothetical protein